MNNVLLINLTRERLSIFSDLTMFSMQIISISNKPNYFLHHSFYKVKEQIACGFLGPLWEILKTALKDLI